MSERVPAHGLEAQGIDTGAEILWNLTTAPLVEHAVRRGEGLLAKDGPLVVQTGKHTGRSAKDKFIVRDADDRKHGLVGQANKPMDARRLRPRCRPISWPRSATRTRCSSPTSTAARSPSTASASA